jgi:hypothetical protein
LEARTDPAVQLIAGVSGLPTPNLIEAFTRHGLAVREICDCRFNPVVRGEDAGRSRIYDARHEIAG